MTLKETYTNFVHQLQNIYEPNEASIIIDWLFENVLSVKRSDIISNPATTIGPEKSIILQEKLIELQQNRPIQYVLGEAWFYNMKLKVNECVLIPRPETEELVQLIMKNEKLKIDMAKSVLDIGTGSGCIPIALKKNLDNVNVTSIDFSSDALDIAKENALTQNTEIKFIQLDFLDEELWKQLDKFDIIVSNPPYIPLHEKETMNKNVTAYEPASALFVPDNNPLLFYRKIALFGKTHLNTSGKIYVEMHEQLTKETAELFAQSYKNVAIKKDMFGKERMVIAY